MRVQVRFVATLAVTVAAVVTSALAGERPSRALPDLPKVDETTRAAAVSKGVAYLDDQLFRLPDAQGSPRKPFTFAVAGLVYLLDKGTRADDPVPRIAEYLERYVSDVAQKTADPSNLPPQHGLASSSYLIQYTWPLAQAGLFFGELHLRGRERRITSRVLPKIVAVLEAAQHENGGWGHGNIDPREPSERKQDGGDKSDPLDDLKKRFPDLKDKLGEMQSAGGGYPETLLAPSNCVAATLGLLRGVLGESQVKSVDAARDYYRAARLPNGSFPYDISQRQAGRAATNAGRTAGALWAWTCLGMPRDDDYEASVDYLFERLDFIKEGHGSPCLNVLHGAFAARAIGEREFDVFRRYHIPRIVAAQGKDGALPCICEDKAFGVTCDSKQIGGSFFETGTTCYTTALHTLVLLLERDNLKLLTKPVKPAPDRPTTPSSGGSKRR
jgi:hypothetical protein